MNRFARFIADLAVFIVGIILVIDHHNKAELIFGCISFLPLVVFILDEMMLSKMARRIMENERLDRD